MHPLPEPQDQVPHRYPRDGSPEDMNGGTRTPKRQRLDRGPNDEDEEDRPRSAPVLHRPSNHPSASIILAPHVAEDVDILQRHMSQHRPPEGSGSDAGQYRTLNQDTTDPIVYLTVPRFRSGLAPELGAGKEQLEILQQLMGPFKREVVDLFFSCMHYAFPVMDEESCFLLKKGQLDKVSKNLVCVVLANGTANWFLSDTLKMHPKPDLHYIWNKAISALHEDFLSPSMATVNASVLDQTGRPSVSIMGNLTLCGRTISLAQTFGLHRDPTKWNITETEKQNRIRSFWGVLITDYWSSIAYGVLPHIGKRFYDVPLPTIDALMPLRATPAQRCATISFVHLCALTELLGDILPLVYEINPNRATLSDTVASLKAQLKKLEDQLPDWLPLPNKPGTSNLWFCFLSVRLLLSRVNLRAAVLADEPALKKARFDELRQASTAILDYICFLGQSQFQDFWLPYATHLLVHAVTVSLRCAVETSDVEQRTSSVSTLERFIAHIQHARDNYDWDIAGYTLERCGESVAKIASLTARGDGPPPEAILVMPERPQDPEEALTGPVMEDGGLLLSDLLDPNAFDFSWEALWNTPSGMTNFAL
ncbi:fungal specific transcription factor domain-containing protein [Paraphaeosphaeria sporulosa]